MREIREIDRGGYGVVHEVLVGRQHLARKTFNPITPDQALREKLKKRFKREVRIQSKINHPNIMPILDSDLDAGVPWFTMPLASESFEQKIIRDRSQGLVDIAAWQDILAAVEELHRLGYVHRDLKPQNLLWLDDKWTLADFGLILPVARDTTIISSSHSAYGSHFYAAPEQLTDFRNAPEQADIFALGCILHDNVESAPSRIPFAQIRSSGPYAVILEKCTEFDPRRRFQRVPALRSALFDQWRVSQLQQPIADDADALKDVLSNPTDPMDGDDSWHMLKGFRPGTGISC
jgi:serine/threonine protein kinase